MLVKSFAKINLILNLGNKIDDKHQFESLMSKIDLCDEIELNIYEGNTEINIAWDIDEEINQNNTVYKAYVELAKIRDLDNLTVDIKIFKKIPLEAGLGGGSSNAAAFINAIDKMLKLKLSLEEKYAIGQKIGMDVNFFFTNKMSIASGFGEIIEDVDIRVPNWNILLTKPNFGCSTKEVYGLYKANQRICKIPAVDISINNIHNDLEEPALQLYPKLKEIAAIHKSQGARKVLLCGSGSTIAGIYETISELKDAENEFANANIEFIKEVKLYEE